MSKAVLISIRPQWCEKIASGEKAIEVRKLSRIWKRRLSATSTAQRKGLGMMRSGFWTLQQEKNTRLWRCLLT